MRKGLRAKEVIQIKQLLDNGKEAEFIYTIYEVHPSAIDVCIAEHLGIAAAVEAEKVEAAEAQQEAIEKVVDIALAKKSTKKKAAKKA